MSQPTPGPTFGTLAAFDASVESWTNYAERLEAFFEANAIVDSNRKRSILITSVGPETYARLRSLLAPKKPMDEAYDEILKVLAQHLNPEPSEIYQTYRFQTRVQGPNEKVADYVAELRKIADDCNFGAALERNLRDRFVIGLRDKTVKKVLLAKPKTLDLNEALGIARAAEVATENVTQLPNAAQPLPQTTEVSVMQATERRGRFQKKTQQKSQKSSAQPCIRCGDSAHTPPNCPHRSATCFKCKKQGHLASACLAYQRKPGRPQQFHAHTLSTGEDYTEPSDPSQHLYSVNTAPSAVQPIVKPLQWGQVTLNMIVDTGSPVCVISKDTYSKHAASWPALSPTDTNLYCYLGKLPVVGALHLPVKNGDKQASGVLYVVDYPGPILCGRDIIQELQLLSAEHVGSLLPSGNSVATTVKELKEEFKDLFEEGTGLMKGPPAHLNLRKDVNPKFLKARSLPYALRDKVAAELDRLCSSGILSPVPHADWATPVVPVTKKDGGIRICGDFKVTLNTACDLEQYPLPRIEDMFASLKGGYWFSKLDLREAYCHVALDEESRNACVINTHKGLYCYNRLPYGIASAPALFQRKMENILQGIPGTQVFLDDVLVAEGPHDFGKTLRRVLSTLRENGIRLREDKCELGCEQVVYLGHRIDREGLHPSEQKLEAIMKAPAPRNLHELRSFLGFISYYRSFLPQMSQLLAPLYNLLRQNVKWRWETKEDAAFNNAKQTLLRSSLLVHYDPTQELILECDASPEGVGAVLSHNVNGVNKPIGFRSRTLTSAEKNYSQLEKEALALIFGVTKFRDYLLGRTFTLKTDHEPLVGLFKETKATPTTAAARIQRWALTLGAYSYRIQYKPGQANQNADALSRLPLPHDQPRTEDNRLQGVHVLDILDTGPVSRKQLEDLTTKDPVLVALREIIKEGWPRKLQDPVLQPFWPQRHTFSLDGLLIRRGERVVIPEKARDAFLQELHDTHMGINATKALARSILWWPGIDRAIEDALRACTVCQQAAPMPSAVEPLAWPATTTPWTRIHVDYAGPIDGTMLLIVVDSYSGWIEALPTPAATSAATVDHLRSLFARFGLPVCLVSDNGTPFTGSQFNEFISLNGIRHLRTAPYHPQSNGLAERAVRTVKDGLKKLSGGSLATRLARWLLVHRRTPSATRGQSPAELMLGFRPKVRMDLATMTTSEPKDDTEGLCNLKEGNPVFAKNYGVGERWVPGVISKVLGNRMAIVETHHGSMRRHIDQLRPRHHGSTVPETSVDWPPDPSLFDSIPDSRTEIRSTPLRRSARTRKAPDRMDL